MTTESKVSHQKIVVLLVFICAAIMTSLFVYKIQHRQAVPAISAENGLIFPAGREIKEFNLITANNIAFNQNNLHKHWTLLFFGFTHCSTICPTTLEMLNRAYPDLKKTYPNLQVALISVDPERDTPASLEKYAKSFNPDFIGATGKINELRKLQSQLGVYAARDEQSPANNYQVMHTASMMLVNPEGEWVALLKYDTSPKQFSATVSTSIQAAASHA